MVVKVLRNAPNPTATLVYEPRTVEFRRLPNDESLPEGAVEELFLRFQDDYVESLLLFQKDQVWLMSETGKTVDRWTI